MGETSLTVVAEMKAKPGKEKDLKGILTSLLEPTRKEEGCLNYDMHESRESPGSFLFHENWTSQEALDSHLETPHLKAFFARIPELVDGDVKISCWKRVEKL